MASEKSIQAKIKKWLISEGHWVVKYPAGNPRLGCEVGVPDLLGCHRPSGMFFALEVKNEIGRVSKIQAYNIKRLRQCGACAGVVRRIEDVKDLFIEYGLD